MNGETRMVSLYGDVLVDTMKALDGKEVVVYGYSRGVNTNQKYWQLQVTRIETNEPVKSDAEKVEEAKAALTLDVTSTGVSFKLPLVGENGATISWTSSNTDVIAINGEDAVVTAPAADTLVKLTATIKIGEAQDTKEFDVTITATIPEFDVTITQPAAGGTVEVKNGADVLQPANSNKAQCSPSLQLLKMHSTNSLQSKSTAKQSKQLTAFIPST